MQAFEPNPTDAGPMVGGAQPAVITPERITMDIHKVLSVLPHRYPFLLVDRVVDFKRDDYLVALKNVSYNEPYFVGHFPVRPVMPGVLIIEALAQATGLLAMASRPEEVGEKALYYFVGIDKARFKRPVEPGDQLILEVELVRMKAGIFKFKSRASVAGETAVEAELTCAMRAIDPKA